MLKDILDKRKESVYSVSQHTGIPYSTLSDIVMDRTDIRNIQARQLYRLSKYLDLSMEYLYESSCNQSSGDTSVIRLSNNGRNVILNIEGIDYQYLGPKNLLSFKKINNVEDNVIYVDTYYIIDGSICVEEEYIDILDVLADYDISIPDSYVCEIDYSKQKSKVKLIDESLMISDGLAISYNVGSASDIQFNITNVNRSNLFMKVRLSDFTVLETNMSKKMQLRAVETIKRNSTILKSMCGGGLIYA